MASLKLTPHEVADRLQVSVGTLANWRSAKFGPPWIKWGRLVRYPEDLLENWVEGYIKNLPADPDAT